MDAALPEDEDKRLDALYDHNILDTAPEQEFNDLVRLAAHVCGVPIAAVSLIDEHRQWFKAITGLDVTETSREAAFCAHTILQPDLMIVPDAQADPRFADNPLVTGDPHIRFYVGAPLITEDGFALGSLCVIDRTPRCLTPGQEETLRLLARQVASHLRAARRVAERERLVAEHERLVAEKHSLLVEKECFILEKERLAAEREQSEAEGRIIEAERMRLAAIVEWSEDAIYSITLGGTVLSWNHGAEYLYGYRAEEIVGQRADLFVAAECRAELKRTLRAVDRRESPGPLEMICLTKTQKLVAVSLRVSPILDANGCVVATSMIAHDITEQNQVEAALESEREFTNALLESLQESIVACDAQGTLTLFNRASRELHGLPEAALPPEQWADHFNLYEADGQTPMQTRDIPLFRALQGETLRDAEMVIAPMFGLARTVLVNGQAIHGAQGKKLGAVVAIHDVTERRRTERELSRMAAIVESSEEAIWAATLDGTLVAWNKGAERLYGYGAAEMIGKSASRLAFPNQVSPVPAVITQLLRGEPVTPIDVQRTRRDGIEFHAALSFSPIRDAAGHMVGLSCIARDITSRKRAEAALTESNIQLQESEERLRRLTDAAFEGIAISHDGILADVNPAFAEMFGCAEPAEMVGTGAAQLCALPSRALVLQKIADGDERPYEAVFQRRDSTTFQAEVRARMIHLNGRPARVTAVRDISERKAMENALSESQAFIQAVADNSASLIYVFDLDTGDNVYANRGLAEFWGYSQGEIRAMGSELVARIIHPDDAPFLLAHGGDFADLPDGQVMEFETRCRHADGGWRWVWNREVVFKRHPDGRPWQVLGTAQDITERHQAGEVLRQSQARLAEAQRIARVGSWEYDPQSGKVIWSGEMFRLLGRDPEAGVPDFGSAMALYHPEDAPILKSLVTRAVQEGIGYELDLRGNPSTFGGPMRWYHTTSETVGNAKGDGFFLKGTLAEITDRKQMEEALQCSTELLREREANLKAILEAAPVILYAADEEGLITLSEGTGLVALGLNPGEAIGRSVFEFSGGDAEIEENTRRALAGESVSYDARVYGLCLHTELRPVQGADGRPAGIIGVCFDVTDRVLSEERFRALFELSSHAHLLFDEQDGIIDCNAAALSMMRCPDKAHLQGMHPALLSPEYQPDGRHSGDKGAEMCALARQNGGHRFEWTRRAADGYEYPVEVTLTPMTLAGRPMLLSVWHDLTERKLQEERIKDHAVVLEFQKQELENANAELATLATTDGLTGLKNHRVFQERLAEEVSRAARYGAMLSLVLLDVDCFKSYNDTHGHPAGDAVLRAVSGILRDCARETDVVARYGGEEFVLVLPQTDLMGAVAIAERLRTAIEEHPWPVRAVTASFGVGCLRLAEESGAELVARADKALYLAKTSGRNCVSCDGAEELVGKPTAFLPNEISLTEPFTEAVFISDAVFVSDLNGMFLKVSVKACMLLGYEEAELIGTSGFDLLHPEDLVRHGWRMDDVAADNIVVTQRRIRRKDGTWLYAELHTRKLSEGRAECVLHEVADMRHVRGNLSMHRTSNLSGNQSSLSASPLLQEAGEGFSMLDALVAAVDNKDRYTRQHSEDVRTFALLIAQELGLDAAAKDAIAVAALVHDVGKIGIPNHILRKPGALTAEEFNAVKRHPQMGAAIVSAVPELSGTLSAVRHHHERWDGAGYPFGLRGEEIPFLARLMAVADAYSAMTTDRPYRQGMRHEKALSVLQGGAGTQWDPECVAAFLRAYAHSNSIL